MTPWIKKSWGEALHSPFALFVVAVFCVVVWPAIYFNKLSDDDALIAQQKAAIVQQQVAAIQAELAAMKKPIFHNPRIDSIAVNDGPAAPPGARALYVHPCDFIYPVRSVDVDKELTAAIGRTLLAPSLPPFPLVPGMEVFQAGHDKMTPKIQIGSNWPRYIYLDYATYLQPISIPGATVQMQGIFLFILDAGQLLPKPGDPKPVRSANPGLQPSCPIASNTPPASPP